MNQTLASAPPTTAQHALDGLRRAILAGTLRPGDRVRQEALAEELGVSIAPVREALGILEQEGQLTYVPRRGYFVRELRLAELDEIYRLRTMIENEVAADALSTLGKAEIAKLKEAARACGASARSGDVMGELEANRRFHFLLFEGPDHRHAVKLIRLLWDSTEPYRAVYLNSPSSRLISSDEHEVIIRCVEEKDRPGLLKALDTQRRRTQEALADILPA